MADQMLFELPKLPYSYNALEPYIDAKTVEVHYSKHHATYTKNLNDLTKGHESFFQNKSIETILSDVQAIPDEIRQGVINQGGGYANHNLYWEILSPNGGGEPDGKLGKAITETFGSFAEFKKRLSQASVSQFGSGWGWLVVNENKQLEIMKTLNQDSPLSVGKIPLLTIDVWEHAYYLKYQNLRADYVEKIWEVINWDEVSNLFEQAMKS